MLEDAPVGGDTQSMSNHTAHITGLIGVHGVTPDAPYSLEFLRGRERELVARLEAIRSGEGPATPDSLATNERALRTVRRLIARQETSR
jgi:hypothetical protein